VLTKDRRIFALKNNKLALVAKIGKFIEKDG
jgi:hypothetical protein